MADSYLQFSEVLPHLTDAELSWLRHQLESVCVIDGREYPAGQLPEGRDVNSVEWNGPRVFRELACDAGQIDDGAGFDFAFCVNADWCQHLWFYADEWGWLERLAHLVCKFLAAFRPGQFWSLTYAATCSKAQVGVFGGGAVFITADVVEWSDSHDFVQQHAVKARERGLRDARLTIPNDFPMSDSATLS